MDMELDKALVRDFPNLYRDRGKHYNESCMYWGFECGDGWEPLIRELSAELEKIILELPPDYREEVRASQVKEKFGTLRFYMSRHIDSMDEHINKAEYKSAITCEMCSRPGTLRKGSWYKTLCDGCEEKRNG